MNRTTFLTGSIVDLVLLEKTDAPIMAAWVNDANLTQFLSRGDVPMTLAAEEEWLSNLYQRPNDLTLGIWHKADQVLIGSCGLHQINQLHQHATFGIMIGNTDYWSSGCGTDALRTLLRFAFATKNLRQVELQVLASNARAVRCYEKCGFVLVGTIPERILKNGVWHDMHIMLARHP